MKKKVIAFSLRNGEVDFERSKHPRLVQQEFAALLVIGGLVALIFSLLFSETSSYGQSVQESEHIYMPQDIHNPMIIQDSISGDNRLFLEEVFGEEYQSSILNDLSGLYTAPLLQSMSTSFKRDYMNWVSDPDISGTFAGVRALAILSESLCRPNVILDSWVQMINDQNDSDFVIIRDLIFFDPQQSRYQVLVSPRQAVPYLESVVERKSLLGETARRFLDDSRPFVEKYVALPSIERLALDGLLCGIPVEDVEYYQATQFISMKNTVGFSVPNRLFDGLTDHESHVALRAMSQVSIKVRGPGTNGGFENHYYPLASSIFVNKIVVKDSLAVSKMNDIEDPVVIVSEEQSDKIRKLAKRSLRQALRDHHFSEEKIQKFMKNYVTAFETNLHKALNNPSRYAQSMVSTYLDTRGQLIERTSLHRRCYKDICSDQFQQKMEAVGRVVRDMYRYVFGIPKVHHESVRWLGLS